jgi:hypothetical protein
MVDDPEGLPILEHLTQEVGKTVLAEWIDVAFSGILYYLPRIP